MADITPLATGRIAEDIPVLFQYAGANPVPVVERVAGAANSECKDSGPAVVLTRDESVNSVSVRVAAWTIDPRTATALAACLVADKTVTSLSCVTVG